MLTVKYFAYGSNIDIGRLKSRVEGFGEPDIKAGVPYTLNNYSLVFNAESNFGSWAFANIMFRSGDKVEGILYDMTSEQFERLDKYEVLYEKKYFQLDSSTIACVYIAKNISFKSKKPTLEYLNIIIDGCLDTGLINTYNKLLEYKLKNYKIRKNKHNFNSVPQLHVTRIKPSYY